MLIIIWTIFIFRESADPQFVVTLNGYDPDGLYSQSEYSTVDDTDGDEWVKDVENKKPLFTSTPEDTLRDHKPAANLSSIYAHIHSLIIPSNYINIQLHNRVFPFHCFLRLF